MTQPNVIAILRRVCPAYNARLADPAILPPYVCASDGKILVWARLDEDRLESAPPGFPAESVLTLIGAALTPVTTYGSADIATLLARLDVVAPAKTVTEPCAECDGFGHLSCNDHEFDTQPTCAACKAFVCDACKGAKHTTRTARALSVQAISGPPWLLESGSDARRAAVLDPTLLATALEVLRDLGAERVTVGRCRLLAAWDDGRHEERPVCFVAEQRGGAVIAMRD